jgi:hypothetical protein
MISTKRRKLNVRFSQGALALLTAALAVSPTSRIMALNATPAAAMDAAQGGPKCDSPEGSWLYNVSIPGYSFQGLESYAAGGTYTEADQLSFSPIGVASAGHGVWKKNPDGTFLLTYLNLTFDAFSSGNPTGSLVVRQKAKLDKTGNHYTGSGDYTYYDLDGNPIPSISGTFTITANRITVSAPK